MMTILNERKEREEKEQSEQKEQREQESRPPESELVVESGNEIKNEVLETVHEGENRVESPVHLVDSQDSTKMLEINQNRLSSSSRSGSDVDCRRKTERTRARVALTMIMNKKLGASRARIANLVKRQARAALMTKWL